MRRALVLWVPLLLCACGGDPATDAGTDGGAFATHEEIRVEADDGSATLIIAPDSLPRGVSAEEIRVLAGASSSTVDPGAGASVLASYELLPDGLTFREPAELLIRTDTTTSPIGVLDSDVGTEGIDVTVAEESVEDGRFVALSAAIPHFSAFFLLVVEELVTTAAKRLRTIGERQLTESLVSVTRNTAPRTIEFYRGDRVVSVDAAPAGGSTVQIVAGNYMRVEPVGEEETAREALPLSWEAKYRCTDAGMMTATYTFYLDLGYQLTIDGVEGSAGELREVQYRPTLGMCHRDPTDSSGDCADSEGPGVTCSEFADYVDLISYNVRATDTLSRAEVEALFGNTAYPCDELGGGVRTVCTATPGVFPEGAMWVGSMILGADVPDADPDHSLIYSLVFDSDGDPANDWVIVPPYVWDYFQGTDRWYQLIWNHLTRTWSVTATQVDASQAQASVPSAVRVVIVGDAVTFFIPITELPSATPAYRFSGFIHDGEFSRSGRGGDVSGSDPTAPPVPADPT